MFYTCTYIRVTHRNGAIKHIFYTNQIHAGDYQQMKFLFILSLHALALHLAVKILLQIFLYEDLSTLALPYICRLYFPPECQQDRTFWLRKSIISWAKISKISDKSSTNTRRSDQIETIKTIMQTTRPRITWKASPMAQVAIFKEIFLIKCEKI